MFSEKLASRAVRDLEALGVQTWTGSRVTRIDENGVEVSGDRIHAATVLWAAGVQASTIGNHAAFSATARAELWSADLSVADYPEVFVAGDLCSFRNDKQELLPGIAPVAMQQGRHFAKVVICDLNQHTHRPQNFAIPTKGRWLPSVAVVRFKVGKYQMTGFFAWLAWLVVHIYFLTGFRNRLFVILSWTWSFLSFRRGARLILAKNWRFYDRPSIEPKE